MTDKLKAALDALTEAESFISGFEDDDTQEGVDAMLERIRAALADPPTRARVLVTVDGGVAEVETAGAVDYELLDFDNLKADGLDRDQRDARYQQDRHWLETGELVQGADGQPATDPN